MSTATETAVRPVLDRDLSWLEFNRRVLHEALDPRTPLLERVKFLGIFNSNLDEFFMKRVVRLKREIDELTEGPADAEADGPYRRLLRVRDTIRPMLAAQADRY